MNNEDGSRRRSREWTGTLREGVKGKKRSRGFKVQKGLKYLVSGKKKITEEGSGKKEITEEGTTLIPSLQMASSGTTSNKNDITEEGTTTSNNNDIKEGMNSISNNGISEDHAILFVAYNGKWEYDGKEWFFKNSKSSIMVVPKHVSLLEITDILNKQFKVNKKLYRLKIEVHYRTGSPWFPPTEIQNNQDLSVFISETSKTKLPLCVTQLDEKFANVLQDYDVDEDRRKDDRHRLINAIKEGDWAKAREIVNTTKEVTWTSKLNDEGFTPLHLVVGGYYKDNKDVRDILRGINSELLVTTVNIYGQNPAHYAASYGNTEALEIMLNSNPKILFIPNDNDHLLIQHAQEAETFFYLFEQMKRDEFEYNTLLRGMLGLNFLHHLINSGMIDVAYELIDDYPSLATTVYKDQTALELIMRKPELFYSGTQYNLFERFVYSHVPIPTENNSFGSIDTADVENQNTPKKDKFVTKYTRRCLHIVFSRLIWAAIVPHITLLRSHKVKHNKTIKLLRCICAKAARTHTGDDIKRLYNTLVCLAVENNNAEAIHVLGTYFKRLSASDKDGQNIFQLIVLNRSEKVYSLILHHNPSAKQRFMHSKDSNGNNILHLAGCLAPLHKLNVASGAALQMQRELQWFEELKRVVGITLTRALNKNKETPMMVFRKEHKELRKDGEEWMKKTADSYTITAALIITIVFAAAITVPGGNDSATGKPIYETKASLIIFAISVAISLFTSTTSLLWFLSILTARYADEDFLYKLPKRLICGLVMLFVSVTSMMIAFSATLYIMFGQEKAWILIPIGALACLPIASFVTLQFPLLVELISSTYGHGIFGKENDYMQSSANANKNKGA